MFSKLHKLFKLKFSKIILKKFPNIKYIEACNFIELVFLTF